MQISEYDITNEIGEHSYTLYLQYTYIVGKYKILRAFYACFAASTKEFDI